ncbi:MAG: branched-chain amino acid ABC transporter permease [Bradyrhizobium sp.]|nr:branched-chain amino acid ABC transporter permease [Bradyrhizobium sp.]
MFTWANFFSQVFNGLALGALLALISSGLTIIYGTLGVLNLAHGAMFMMGGYAIVMVEAVRLIFSSLSKNVPAPPLLSGITSLGVTFYPTYRIAVVGIVTVALLGLYFVLYRTKLGMIVRAGIEDSEMVDSLGINVYRVFMIVFGIGAMAAGFAGIVNAPVVSLTPDVGEAILVQTFVVVVIGGVGSFPGAVLGGLIAGEIISITSMINPGYAYVMLFAAITLVLVLRPYGLLGTRGRE